MKINLNPISIKSVFAALLLLAILPSCEQNPTGNLDTYIAQRDSLQKVKEEVERALSSVEEKIAALDTAVTGKSVTLYNVKEGTFRHFFEVYGNVQTDRAATLYPESQGLVKEISVSEGQNVKKGQVLLRLDAELINSSIAEVKTSLDLANVLFEKQERLWEQNIGSEVQYLEAKNRKESLEKTLETLREQVNKSTIRAPFDGVVDKILPKVGEMASPAMPAVRLVNMKNLYITADVSEGYLGRVKAGDLVEVIIAKRDTITTTLSRVGSYINPNNRSFEVRIDLEEEIDALLPNSLVVVKINDFEAAKAVAIPSSLVLQDGAGKDYVFIAENTADNQLIARKRLVKTGLRYQGRTFIEEGISHGAVIIQKGARSVREGDPVKATIL